MQCINPDLIRIVNTYIFLPQVPNTSPLRNAVAIPQNTGHYGRLWWLQAVLNPLNPELNPICYLLALLRAHYFLHVSRIRVKSLTIRLLMSYIYIYGAPILDVSRSHTTTHHSR